eukprot:CAMPEP_0114134226 /NCGR_PEP_ID=MMETSP0043_2-20121206/14041_1 /TAXON_ID=464988 /ORGANISM="Hemiselmis andersenii, Strain CCMP644" /LENGTH=150 /DNA_ID=CAMNT_0001227845 /DNA_START=312 /DNA_END=761 /DNA_ORIENTATION=+
MAEPHSLGAVLSLNERWEVPLQEAEYEALGVAWKHIAVPDYSAPSLEAIVEGVRWIHKQVGMGRGVLVHCNAGRGRSVIIVLAYLLVKHKAFDCESAYEHVKSRRDVANLRVMWGTRPQWRSLKKFHRWLRRQGGDEWLTEKVPSDTYCP